MIRYIIRRALGAIALLVAVSFVTFCIFFLLPRLAGASSDDLASSYVGKTASQAQIHEMAKKLGFTDPIYVQYGRFVKGLVLGTNYNTGPTTVHCPAPCFGYSFVTQNPVFPELVDRASVTASLTIGAALLWLLGGVAAGVLSALRKGSVFDRSAMGWALAGVSLPIYFTGLASLAIFSYALHWTAPGGSYTAISQNPLSWAYDLLLPWITLAFLNAALYARLTRAGMLEVMNEDYIRTARAKGLSDRRVVFKHALRSTLTPVLTIFGLDLGLLLGGAVLTESTFSLNGLGKYAIDGLGHQDLPKVLGVVMFGAFFIVIANLIVDVLYAVIDPRVRLS